jgi:hypothetical protein
MPLSNFTMPPNLKLYITDMQASPNMHQPIKVDSLMDAAHHITATNKILSKKQEKLVSAIVKNQDRYVANIGVSGNIFVK